MAVSNALHIDKVLPAAIDNVNSGGDCTPIAGGYILASMRKREIESWEKAECSALKAAIDAFNAGKPRGDRLTQSRLAEELGINQGSASAYLNGYNAINSRVASTVSRLTGIPVSTFSARLAAEIAEIASVAGEQHYQKDDKYQSATPEHRQAVDELVDKLLDLSPEQALKVKQAMELLMPTDDRTKN